jgi:Flp pilus assembly protein TadD
LKSGQNGLLRDNEQWGKAITLYEHALPIDPRNADVRTDIATSCRNIGMSARALAEYRKELACVSGHVNARYNLGVVYTFDEKDYHSVSSVWEGIRLLSPNHSQVDSMRSNIVIFTKTLNQKDTK